MKYLLLSVLLISACGAVEDDEAAPPLPVRYDFYECEPDNTLLVCEKGTAPQTIECRAVGDGETTLTAQDCDLL